MNESMYGELMRAQTSTTETGEDQWTSEAVQLGGVRSRMGVIGMWTGTLCVSSYVNIDLYVAYQVWSTSLLTHWGHSGCGKLLDRVWSLSRLPLKVRRRNISIQVLKSIVYVLREIGSVP
jgi:hypothetical protein